MNKIAELKSAGSDSPMKKMFYGGMSQIAERMNGNMSNGFGNKGKTSIQISYHSVQMENIKEISFLSAFGMRFMFQGQYDPIFFNKCHYLI